MEPAPVKRGADDARLGKAVPEPLFEASPEPVVPREVDEEHLTVARQRLEVGVREDLVVVADVGAERGVVAHPRSEAVFDDQPAVDECLRRDQDELDRPRRYRVRELRDRSTSRGRLCGRWATVPVNCESSKHTDANGTGRERGGRERWKGEWAWFEKPGEYAPAAMWYRLRAQGVEQASPRGRIDSHRATRLAGNPPHVRIERVQFVTHL